MIINKTSRRLYVTPKIECTCIDEDELMQMVTGTVPDKTASDDFGGNAKSSFFLEGNFENDFEEEDFEEDDFNYYNYKKKSMLW